MFPSVHTAVLIEMTDLSPETRARIEAVLEDADLAFSAVMLVETFGGGILPKEAAAALDQFIATKSIAAAMRLVAAFPESLHVFASSQRTRRWREQHRMDASHPRPNARQLMKEPKFQALVDAVLEGTAKIASLRASLMEMGYTDQVIDAAIAQYFADLA